ncbi:MAG TPA: oxidoreductase [Mycobacteriales bacterium]|jgi:NAD(P)-dependent dehydrogenase (short-subunit alcohol dehydrogenase family)|nr:oxidoreductase [Mycobacteriales bacterium]
MPWTAADIPDLTGRTAVVTGANSGIGFRAAVELARHGAAVTLAARDPGRGADALRRLLADVPAAEVTLAKLDLADLASVRTFAETYHPDGLDLLVNNAGVMAPPLRRTADGFESQFGTNHLGHFALTGLLLPRLLARPGARVVTVTSTLHTLGRMSFDDLDAQGRYRKWPAYARSKLANLLFTFELQRRADDAGVDLRSVAAHPGYTATNLQTAGPKLAGSKISEYGAMLMTKLIGQPDTQGALPTLRAATDPAARGGEVFGPSGFQQLHGAPIQVPVSKRARDRADAERLWAVSEEKTGVRYPAFV